uniref:ZZ-type domain-containing protein n=1 Tax=Strongyloides papillosus TaxID=174720 RepID=A0A0N5CAK1_STREA
MSTIIVKLICFDRIKLLESDNFVKYPEIRSTYDSMVPTPLRVGFSNLLFKNDKGEVFEISDNESFWAYITLQYPKAKTQINEVPVIIIPVLVKNPDYLNTNGLTIHQHIICDSCNRKVAGIRYKCLVCDDYDLCQYCERQNIHDSSHVMLRFARPVDSNSRKYLNSINQHTNDETTESSVTNCETNKKTNDTKKKHKKKDSKTSVNKIYESSYATIKNIDPNFEYLDFCDAYNNYLYLVKEIKSIKKSMKKKFHTDGELRYDDEMIAENIAKIVETKLSHQQRINLLKFITIEKHSPLNLDTIKNHDNEKVDEKIVETPTGKVENPNENEIPPNDESINEVIKDPPKEEEENKGTSVCSEPISVLESHTTCSEVGINNERKLSAFELSINSTVSTEEDDDESNYGIEIIDHRSEANTSSSISDWKDTNDELDYKSLVKQMEMQRSGVFEKIIDDIEPEDSASMIGSRNSINDIEVNQGRKSSSLSFSIISRNTNETITSDKNKEN